MLVSYADPTFDSALPPQNIEAEESILGGILLDPKAMGRVKDLISPESFYVRSHVEIYRAALKLHNQGKPTDLMTVSSELQDRGTLLDVGGLPRLLELVDRTVSAANIDKYAELVQNKYIRRQAISAAGDVIEYAREHWLDLDSCLEKIQKRIEEVTGGAKPGEDKNYHRFQRTIERVKAIEQTIVDPAYKEYCLMQLSRELGIPTRGLNNLYSKYLACRENESPMTIEKLRETYGSNVQEWFLHGFAPKGSVVLLHALGGTGKTRLIYDWIYHMVTGTPWNDFQVTAPSRRVLIVQTDESQSDLLGALDTRGFTSEMPVRIKTRWTADHMAALRKDIEEWKPEVILIDSLTSVNRNSMFSENDTEYARPVLELRDLAQEFGCLVYLIHHSNSEGGSRGTKAIVNSVSHVFTLKRPEGNSDPRCLDRLLIVEKSRSRAPAKYKLSYDPQNGSWDCEKSEPDTDKPTKDRIIKFLLEHAGIGYEPTEIANELGSSLDRVRSLLYELADHGEISRRRRYRQGGGYLYFLCYEGDRGEGDHLPIALPDHLPNPDGERDTGEGDRAIEKIEGDRLLDGEKNEADPITFSENPHHESDSEDDREGDLEGDRLLGDHLPTDPADGSEWVNWKGDVYRVIGKGFGFYTLRRSGFTRAYKAPAHEVTPIREFPKA
jgi:replicative DNA helicase